MVAIKRKLIFELSFASVIIWVYKVALSIITIFPFTMWKSCVPGLKWKVLKVIVVKEI